MFVILLLLPYVLLVPLDSIRLLIIIANLARVSVLLVLTLLFVLLFPVNIQSVLSSIISIQACQLLEFVISDAGLVLFQIPVHA